MDTIHGFLLDVQRIMIQLHREANERPAPFVDHTGVLRDSKTGRPINAPTDAEDDDLMGRLFSILDLSSAVEYLVLQSAIPSSTARRSSWLVGESVTRTTTSAKPYRWPNIDRNQWDVIVWVVRTITACSSTTLVCVKVSWTFPLE